MTLKMKLILFIPLILAGFFLSVALSGTQPADTSMETAQYFPEASEISEKTGKPIMMVFTGKNTSGQFWCPPCAALDRRVFQTAKFSEWAGKNVVKLEVIFPHDEWESEKRRDHNTNLQMKYEITGVPTVVFTDSEGNILGVNPSWNSVDQWLEDADNFLKKG